MVAIMGNTYPVKDQIKALGGRWNPDQKVWMVPEDKAEAARALVVAAPESQGNRRPYIPSKCKECGRRGDRYNKIYRNGICRDCWRSEQEEREMGY